MEVLRAEDHGSDALRLVALVLDRHLALAVGTDSFDLTRSANLRQSPGQAVRQHDRQRHQLRGLIAGEPIHHALIAGALILVILLVDSLGDVRALLMNAHQDSGIFVVDTELWIRVADLLQGLPGDALNIGVALGAHFAGDNHSPGRDKTLDRHSAIGVLLEKSVQDRVGDPVTNLVGMPLGDRFAGDIGKACHRLEFLSVFDSRIRFGDAMIIHILAEVASEV